MNVKLDTLTIFSFSLLENFIIIKFSDLGSVNMHLKLDPVLKLGLKVFEFEKIVKTRTIGSNLIIGLEI